MSDNSAKKDQSEGSEEEVENDEDPDNLRNNSEHLRASESSPLASPRASPLLAITWPWSSLPAQTDTTDPPSSPNATGGRGSGGEESEQASTGSGLFGISWPWSRTQSLADLHPEPNPDNDDLTSNAVTPTVLVTHENSTSTPSHQELAHPPSGEIRQSPTKKKSLFPISWPWASEKRSSEAQLDSSPDKSPDTQSKTSGISKNLLNMHWPWSSTEQSPNESPANLSTSDSKVSRRFSEQVADFARRALPDKLLAMTPWANKPSQDEEISVLHGPGRKTDVQGDTYPPIIPLHKAPADITSRKTKEKIPSKNKYSNDLQSSASSNASLSYDQDSVTLLDDLNMLNFSIPDHLAESMRPTKCPESNWATAFHHLSTLAAEDERYDPIKIVVFRDKTDHNELNSESSEGSRVSSTISFEPHAHAPDARRSTPFMYNHRPFRMPRLAIRRESRNSGGSTPNIFKFDPIKVSSQEWAGIHTGSETYLAATKWTLPEPIRADKRLLPQIDPLVKYKLKRLGKNKVTPAFLQETQKEIALGISPSGRKLDGYTSGSGEECVYKRVLCKNDPDFDIIQPYFETESGDKWPNPFLFYWNWKKTDEDVNESYLHHQRLDKDHDLAPKRRIALELESYPLKIPYQNLGAEDTDYEDPYGPVSSTPVSILDKFSLWKPSQSRFNIGTGDILEDPIARRYPYLLLDQYSKYYRKVYQLKLLCQAQHRKFYEAYMRILGKYTSSFATVSSYPLWFFVWKRSMRYLMRRVPRKWKFCKEKRQQTVFYGTFASLYATQYIPEHNLLPNMDDPVCSSQLALEKALEIKDHYLTFDEYGRPYVDYIKMQRSKMYEKYMECIGMLCRFQPIKMPPRVRKVFFINYFNVLSIQTQILRIPEKENTTYLWEMEDFWGKTKGLAGFMELSLEEIYHGILRCNRLHPVKQTRVFEEHPVKGFPKEMSPSRLSLDWVDPRIHFTLSVGCKSCPPIHSFSLYEQDFQLNEVARTYVRQRIKINVEQRVVTLPILFLWYERDFGNNKFIMLWYLKQFMLSKDVLKVRQLLSSGDPIRFRYERFNEEIDPIVKRHPISKCEPSLRKKIIPVYWGSKF